MVLAIIVASDKTQLSQHSGDASAHPVYLSLANFKRSERCLERNEASQVVAIIPDPPKAPGMTKVERDDIDYKL